MKMRLVTNQSIPQLVCIPLLALLSSLGLSCSDECPTSTDPVIQAAVLLERDEFSRQTGPSVEAVLANQSSRSLYVFSCSSSWTVERQDSTGAWVSLGAPWYLPCDGPAVPIPVEPGGYAVAPPIPRDTYSNWLSATYRMRVAVYLDQEMREPLSGDREVSRPFRLAD